MQGVVLGEGELSVFAEQKIELAGAVNDRAVGIRRGDRLELTRPAKGLLPRVFASGYDAANGTRSVQELPTRVSSRNPTATTQPVTVI